MKKKLGFIFTIIKLICVIVLVLLIAVLALQRFSNNEIAIGGIRVFNVVTTSMVPKYVVGDVVVVKSVDTNELKVGDDVTYLGKVDSFAGRVVTHSIKSIELTPVGKVFHTQGIANTEEDPPITADQIYGKVIYKCVVVSAMAKLMNNMTMFYIIVFIPLAILIVLQIVDFVNERKEDDDEDDEEDDDDDEYDEDEEDEDDDDDE